MWVNSVLGIAIGWLIVFVIFPYLDHMSDAERATWSSGIFLIASYARAYGVRRLFNYLHIKGYLR
jgi:hypothetical protein